MSTFSIHYVSAATGQLCPMDSGYNRRQLREALASFRWYANTPWRGADAWLLKRDRKIIAKRVPTKAERLAA